MTVPEFMKQDEALPADSLATLARLVDDYETALFKVQKAEEALKELQEKARLLGQNEIPNLLQQYGLSELRMADGRKVSVKPDISVTITDETAFHGFLAERKEDDIIKLAFQFGKMPGTKQTALFKYLNSKEYEYESKKTVHPQTLKKYMRELLGLDGGEGSTANEALVENFAKVFRYNTTKIK